MRSCTRVRIVEKNRRWSLQFSSPQSSSMHYLVQFYKVIVVVLSIYQPISSIICARQRTAGDITD